MKQMLKSSMIMLACILLLAGAAGADPAAEQTPNDIQSAPTEISVAPSANQMYTVTAQFAGVWWWAEDDQDGDGYVSSVNLDWKQDVLRDDGYCYDADTMWVYEKVYWKSPDSITWHYYTTTTRHMIWGCGTHADHLTITGLPHRAYDWKLEVYRDGTGAPDATTDVTYVGGVHPYPCLYGYKMETAAEDVSVVVAGYIRTSAGDPVEGVTLSGFPSDVMTGADGHYACPVYSGWSGTITPQKFCYSSSPASITYTNLTASKTNENYISNPRTYIVSGYMLNSAGQGVGGVTMDGLPTVTITETNGFYSCAVPCNWTGTVTPQKDCATFSPVSRSYSNVVANYTGQTYTCTNVLGVTISGSVKTLAGVAIAGVEMVGFPVYPPPVTDSNGNYSAMVYCGSDVTITPTMDGYTFSPASRTYANIHTSASGQNYTGLFQSVLISGTVMGPSGGLSGVIMDGLPGLPTTGKGGVYSCAVPIGWSGRVRPVMPGYYMTPYLRTYTNVTTTQSGQNYTASTPATAIYGRIVDIYNNPLANVSLRGLPGTPLTDQNGNYFCSVQRGWSGTVTPSKTGYTFSPISRVYSNVSLDLPGQNYAGSPGNVTISGQVKSTAGVFLSGVTITGLPGPPVTNANGEYTATVTIGWSGTATPAKDCYTITPHSRTYTNVTAEITGNNYTAAPTQPVVSGVVKDANGQPLANVPLDGFPVKVKTDANGVYSCAVSCGWSGTISPYLTCYSFSPSDIKLSNVTDNRPAQNFTGTKGGVTLAGYVRTAAGAAVAGVAMTGVPIWPYPETDANGHYSIPLPCGWNGELAPSKTGYAFTPPTRFYMSLTASLSAENFTAGSAVTIANAWWTNRIDRDQDGYVRAAQLHWDPNAILGGFNPTVFEKVYYRPSAGGIWTLFATTTIHLCDMGPREPSMHIDVAGMDYNTYDWKIEIYREGAGAPDDTRDYAADTDLRATLETPVQDAVARIRDAWWFAERDRDCDGAVSLTSLRWNPIVDPCEAGLQVREKVYFRDQGGGWQQIYATPLHPLNGCDTANAGTVVSIGFGDPRTVDWKIEIYRGDNAAPDYVRDTTNDTDLNDHRHETGTTDIQITVSGLIKTAAGTPVSGVVLDGFPVAYQITTDGAGAYSWPASCGWSGTVTPRKTGYTFSPPSFSFTPVNVSRIQNFTASPTSVTISGTVKYANGFGFAGVTMNGLPGPPVTDASGYYAASVSSGWTGTVTPAKGEFLFNPSSRSYLDVLADIGNQDYVGALDVRLKGTYTIGRNNAVFYNFAEAVNALMTNGIAGPVVFEVQPGAYHEQMAIGPIAGSSNLNTVTFQSLGNNHDLDTIIYQATSPADNFVVKLVGADYVIFREMTFIAAGTDYARVFHLAGDANGNEIIGNSIIGVQRDSYDNALIYASENEVDGTIISTNTLMDGGYAVVFKAGDVAGGEGTSTRIMYNRVLRCRHGIEVESHYGPQIISNALDGVMDGPGVHCSACTGGIIVRNCFIHVLRGDGLWLENCPGDPETRGLIANNVIRAGIDNETTTAVRFDSASYLDLLYNTIMVTTTHSYSTALSLSDDCRHNRIMNNLIASLQGAYVCIIDTAAALDAMDYNDLYTPGNIIGRWGALFCTDLTKWNEVTKRDSHSVAVYPAFTTPDGPIPQSPYMDGKAIPFPQVPSDYMGAARDPLHPDIGAVEFTPLPEVMTPMSGTFTVGPGDGSVKAGANRDYTTLSGVIAALAIRGMDSQVTINLVDGTYHEQVTIPPIPGATLDGNLTIQSQSGNPEGVVLSYTSAEQADNYVLRLIGADYVTIKNVTVSSLGASYGRGLDMIGEVEEARILHNIFQSGPADLCEHCAGIDMNNAYCTSRIIRWNHFSGGNGIDAAMGDVFPAGIQITDNTFDEAGTAVALVKAADPVVDGNIISCVGDRGQGIWLNEGIGSVRIMDNRITVRSGRGIELANCDPLQGAEQIVANNFIECGSGLWYACGLFVSNCRALGIFHNSVNVTSIKNSEGWPLQIFNGDSVRIIDNIFVNSAGGLAYDISSPMTVVESDYNDFYNGGNDSLIRWGGGLYGTVTAFSAANGKDQHSVSADPCFFSAVDLHARAMEIDGAGIPLSGMIVDIDGQPWNAAYPDLGADEFTYDPNTPPVAVTDTIQSNMDSLAVIYVLRNDHDADGDAIRISGATIPIHGAITLLPGDSTIRYLPSPGYVGEDGFRYIITDGKGCYDDTAEVVVIVLGPTDVPTESEPLPREFVLGQNYPNPFNPRTTIDFSLPRQAFVRVAIFNLLGQQVKMLMNEMKQAGTYHLVWDGTVSGGRPAASGVYFYRLEAGDFVTTRKMVLLK